MASADTLLISEMDDSIDRVSPFLSLLHKVTAYILFVVKPQRNAQETFQLNDSITSSQVCICTLLDVFVVIHCFMCHTIIEVTVITNIRS